MIIMHPEYESTVNRDGFLSPSLPLIKIISALIWSPTFDGRGLWDYWAGGWVVFPFKHALHLLSRLVLSFISSILTSVSDKLESTKISNDLSEGWPRRQCNLLALWARDNSLLVEIALSIGDSSVLRNVLRGAWRIRKVRIAHNQSFLNECHSNYIILIIIHCNLFHLYIYI